MLQTISSLLDGARGDGFARARGFAHAVRGHLDSRIEVLQAEVDADRQQLDLLLASYGETGSNTRHRNVVEELQQAFSILPRKTSDAKSQFMQQWWEPYARTMEALVVGNGELAVLQELSARINRLAVRCEDVAREFKRQVSRLEAVARSHFGGGQPGRLVLEDRVLDSREMVDLAFAAPYAEAAAASTGEAPRIAQGMVAAEGVLRPLILNAQDSGGAGTQLEASIADIINTTCTTAMKQAEGAFQPAVEAWSIWDALEREFYTRMDLRQFDVYLGNMAGINTDLTAMRAMCRQYISARVRACVDRAIPYWNLDEALLDQYQQLFELYRTGIAGFSMVPFADTSNQQRKLLLDDLKSIAGGSISLETSDQSQHQFYVSSREFGVPLMMLGSIERERLLASEREWTRTRGHVFVDQRYVGKLPTDFHLDSVREIVGSQQAAATGSGEALLIAKGFQTGNFRFEPSTNGNQNMRVVQVTATPAAPNWESLGNDLGEALSRLRNDPMVTTTIDEYVAAAFNAMAPAARQSVLKNANAWAAQEFQSYGGSLLGASPHREALKLMQSAVDEALRTS